MPSPPGKLDQLDWKFLLARTGFLLLGALATALMTIWVPAIQDLGSTWSPLIVMAITAAAEALNRLVKNSQQEPKDPEAPGGF